MFYHKFVNFHISFLSCQYCLELSTLCNGRNIPWFLKVLNKQIKSETFLLSDDKSGCLIFIERIVYFEKKFAMSLQTYDPDNASYKIIIFSFA